MKFSHIGLASAVMVLGANCPDLKANGSGTLDLDQVAPYNYYVGGEFMAYVTSGSEYVQNYSPLATSGGGFGTFCIEVDSDFVPGESYNFALNPSQSADGHTLTEGAAWLYAQFATGNLSDYNYANPSGSFSTGTGYNDAAELQAALWWFQGDQHYGDPAFYPSGTNNYFYQLALNSLGLNSSTAGTPDNGQFGVEVLDLTYPNGDPAQNQLVYVGDPAPNDSFASVPDQAGTLGLLTFGLLGLAAFAQMTDRLGARQLALQPRVPSPRRHSPNR